MTVSGSDSAASRRGASMRSLLPSFLFAALKLLASAGQLNATPVQVSGNLAFLPNQLGELTVVQLAGGTNTMVLSTYSFVKDIGGVALQGRYAYVSVTNESLIIFDLGIVPPEPVTGGRFLTLGAALDVKVAGHAAFVADGDNGIAVVDVFEANGLMGLPRLQPPGSVTGLDVWSNRLYAACGSGGLRIFDITDAGAIPQLGQRNTVGAARRVRAFGNVALVACANGRLEIVNVQNPGVPTLASTYLGGGSLQDVDLAGNFAVLANNNGAVTLLNLSNPSSPVPLSTNVVAGGAYGVRLVGNQAFVRNNAGSLVVIPLPALSAAAPHLQQSVQPELVPVGRQAVLSVLAAGTPPLSYRWHKNGLPLSDDGNVSGTKNTWLVIASAGLADSGTYSVTVSNAFGQLSSSNVLTVVHPGAPVLRGSFNPGGTAESVDATDFKAYVAAGINGLEIFEVSNPRHPVRTAGAEVPGYSAGIRVLGETGEHIFMATDTNGLQVFHLLPFTPATLIAATNTPGRARAVYLDGGLSYLADGESGLQIYALGDSLLPTTVGAYDTPGFAWNVFVADGIAYVADGTNGLQIISVTNPAAPMLLGAYDTPGEARNVKVFDGRAYVADGAAGLVVLSVSNLANPTLLGSFPAASPALDLEFIENIVVLAKGDNGIESLNVADPAAITSLGVNLSAVPANALRLEGNGVYVAAGVNGVKILELVGLSASFPEITASPLDVVTLPGSAVSFPVGATGTAPLTYQWFKDGVALLNTAGVRGSASSTLLLSNLQAAASGEYFVVVRNAWNLSALAWVNLQVVPVGTPVLRSGYFDAGDFLSVHVVGQVAFVASRTGGLLTIDCRDPLNPVRVGQHATLDFAQDVEVQGRYAYVATWGAGLEVFDVLNPTNLVRVGQCDTPGRASEVRVRGQRAYVSDRTGANGVGGFAVIDITEPTRPALLGTAATSGFAEGLAAENETVFVAAAQAGVEVFDASNPLGPVRIAQLDTPGNAEGVSLVGSHAYVSDYSSGLQIMDALHPDAPVTLGEFPTAGDAFSVQIVSNRAYVANGVGRVQVVDVSDENAPTLITTSLAGKSVQKLQVIGQHAFLADRESGLLVAELLGFGPSAPRVVNFATNVLQTAGRELVLSVAGEGTPPLSYAWYGYGSPLTNSQTVTGTDQPHLRFPLAALTNSGNYRVVIANAQGSVTSAVAVVTVNAFGAPTPRSTFDTPGTAVASAIQGNFAFVADGASLRSASFRDIDNPAPAGSYVAAGLIHGINLQTNLLFLALGTNGVEIVDVSNPALPQFVGAFDTPGTALRVQVVGDVAFVADGESGLQIYQVANPANPVQLGAVETAGSASDVHVAGGLAFVADGAAGLQIFSVTNPALPVLIGGYSDSGVANGVRVVGTRAYIANGTEGLLILDVSSPATPFFLGEYPAEYATALDVVGSLVILALGTNGYEILDATNPGAVIPLGAGSAGAAVAGVTLVGDLAFLAAGPAGLHLLQLAGVLPAPPAFVVQPVPASVLHGSTVVLEALAVGTPPFTYRWYLNGLPVFDDARISGAATTHLSIDEISFADAGDYTLRVLNPWGVTNSANAEVRFIGPVQAEIDAAATGAVIHLAPGIYEEALVFDKSVTLVGPWWDQPVFSGAGHETVLRVLPGANVTLRGITLRGGAAASGGGILNEGVLSLDHCLVTGNTADSGGGIANVGTLRLTSSSISNNVAGGGGGIYNAPGATIFATNCTIVANQAADGAGLFNQGTFIGTSSLVASNRAQGLSGNGGGVRAVTGQVQLINSTVSGNLAAPSSIQLATGLGGGVCVNGGLVEFHSSTIAFNTAVAHGGGVSIAPIAQVHAKNSIFADNLAPDSPDFGGVMYSDGYNLVQNAVGLAVVGVTAGNQVNLNARLTPLRDNGGPTATHLLATNSPAIDAGASPGPATDARGLARPFDIPWLPNAADGPDIGATEFIDQSLYLIHSNRTAVGFTLAWGTNSLLQSTPELTLAWLDRTNTSPLFISTLTNEQHYFRLRAAVASGVLTTNNQTTNGFTLSWPGIGILERAPTTDGPWEAVSGVSPVPVTIDPALNEFFRLRLIEH